LFVLITITGMGNYCNLAWGTLWEGRV